MIRHKKSRADYPDGILAIYGNGRSYLVVYEPFTVEGHDYFPALAMNDRPTHPQGIGMRCEYTFRPTRGRGDRVIAFDALPEDCRRCVEDDLRETATA